MMTGKEMSLLTQQINDSFAEDREKLKNLTDKVDNMQARIATLEAPKAPAKRAAAKAKAA